MKLKDDWNANLNQIVQVDHMKIDSTSNQLFGTTRTSESNHNPQPGLEIYIFIVKLLSDGKIDQNTNPKVKKIDSTAIGVNSYVTGIDTILSDNTF